MSLLGICWCRILLLACVLLEAGAVETAEDGRVVLNLGFLTSKTGGFISSGTILAAELALEYINNDTTFLPDYYLNLTVYDDGCVETTSLDSFFEHWSTASQPSPFFFAGGCSASSGPPGDVSRTFNTIQLANVAGSPIFSDKRRYPHFFRALPPEPGIQRAQGIVVNHFEWTEVAYIAQNEHLFSYVITDIEKFYKNVLMIPSVQSYLFPSRLPVEGLELFWSQVPRVVIVNAYETETRNILCQAYNRNFYYPNYQFIIVGWLAEDFWVTPANKTALDCTDEEFERFMLNNLITVDFNFFAENKSAEGIFNLSTNTFQVEYGERLNMSDKELKNTSFSATTFDAVYAAALTMKNALPELEAANLSLENFTFESSDEPKKFAEILEKHLINISFTGVSGPFTFNKDQDRDVSKAEVRQWRVVDGKWDQVAIGEVLIEERQFQYINGETERTVFPAGIPRDTPSHVHIGLLIVMVSAACAGIVFSIFCIIFNFVFRNKRFIKLTSPNLSYSMPLGAILLYIIVIITGLPVRSLAKSYICNFQLWLGSLGFTLIFGGILVRTWRIHYIFNRIVVSKIRKKPPKDWQLVLAIGVFLLIDLAVLTVLTGVPHIRLMAIETKLVRSSSVVDICSGVMVDYVTVGVLLVYKSVYLWVGLYLAFETRKVKVKALADSQYIAASVYVSIMTCIAIVPVALWLRDRVDIYYGLLSGILMLGLTTVLALVFLPKMIGLYKSRNIDDSELTANFTSGMSRPSAVATSQPNENEVVLKLHQRVNELEERLALYESNGNALEERERKVTIMDSQDLCRANTKEDEA